MAVSQSRSFPRLGVVRPSSAWTNSLMYVPALVQSDSRKNLGAPGSGSSAMLCITLSRTRSERRWLTRIGVRCWTRRSEMAAIFAASSGVSSLDAQHSAAQESQTARDLSGGGACHGQDRASSPLPVYDLRLFASPSLSAVITSLGTGLSLVTRTSPPAFIRAIAPLQS